jgi:hypothetical protein
MVVWEIDPRVVVMAVPFLREIIASLEIEWIVLMISLDDGVEVPL